MVFQCEILAIHFDFCQYMENLGYNCIIYYATVVGLDASLYESASIDGANRWQRIVHITLPGLKQPLSP